MTDVIDLSAEHLGLPTPEHVRQGAKDALDAGETHYTTRPGINPLRRAVAEKLAAENGIAVHPEREVLITCGEQEALWVALHVLLEPGDEAILTAPARAGDAEIVTMARATPRALAADPDRGLALDADAVARAVTDRTRAVVLRAPGLIAPGEAELSALAGIVGEHDLTVIAVESLEPLLHDGAVHRSFAALPGMAERTVTINGFSAVWGLEAWRVAYLAGPEALVGPMIALKQALSICSPAVSQYAALAAVLGPQDRMAEARAEVRARRAALVAALEEGGARSVAPAAGWHVLVEAGEAAAQAAGVRAAPGDTVGLPGWLRLSLTEPPERLALAGRRLAAALTAPDHEEAP
jgi:aspartate/methionine/tyrosine aminotransferase